MGVQQKIQRQGNALKTMQLAGRKSGRRCAVHRDAARRGSQSAYKKDCDTRPRGVATKVRTPFRQTSNATLKAAFAVGGQSVTVARGNEPTKHRHTTGAITFSCLVGDDERHDVRSGHPIKFVHVRFGRRDGRWHEPSNFQ